MRVRLFREAGGFGDVVRCLAVARSIKEAAPSSEVWFYVYDHYAAHVEACPDVDYCVKVSGEARRPRNAKLDPAKYPYMRSDLKFDASVSLYCPAWDLEKSNKPVDVDRTTVWTRVAADATGLDLKPMVARIDVPCVHRDKVRDFLKEHGLKLKGERERPLVAIAHRGSHPMRQLTDSQLESVCRGLKQAGMDFLVAARPSNTLKEIIERCGGVLGWMWKQIAVYELIRQCDHLVTVDTGALHIGAVVGTPATGVFGCTEGKVMNQLYQLNTSVDPSPEDWATLKCGAPCMHARYPEQREICGDGGCMAMMRISGDRILDAVFEAMLARR